MKLELEYRSQYGKDRFFPINDRAKLLIDIVPRRIAFNKSDIEKLKAIGFDVDIRFKGVGI